MRGKSHAQLLPQVDGAAAHPLVPSTAGNERPLGQCSYGRMGGNPCKCCDPDKSPLHSPAGTGPGAKPEEGNRRYSEWPEVPHRWSTNHDKPCIFHCCLGNIRLGTLKCSSRRVTPYLKHRLNNWAGLNCTFHRMGHKHCRFHPSHKIPFHSWPRRALLLAHVTCLCRRDNCCQQVPNTRNRTHDKLHI